MKIETNETDAGVVIKLEGQMILGYEANDLHEAIENAIRKNKKKMVVDLSKIKFISRWGIGILMYGYTTTTSNGDKFRLAGVSEKIGEVFKKIKMDTVFEKYTTVEEALRD